MNRAALVVGVFGLCLSGCPSSTAPSVAPPPAASPVLHKEQTVAAPAGVKAPGEAGIGDRSRCPVSGEEFTIHTDSPSAEYGGRTYYFCCEPCAEGFTAEPEKYLKSGS